VFDNTQITERITDYFTKTGFKLIHRSHDKFKFIHNSSFFDTWTINPLHWGSEIIVSVKDNEIMAAFNIDTKSQMNSAEEINVWCRFITNFQSFITNSQNITTVTKISLKEVKNSRIMYIGWTIVGCVFGGVIGMYISKLTENETLFYIALPSMATLFFKISIGSKKKQKTL